MLLGYSPSRTETVEGTDIGRDFTQPDTDPTSQHMKRGFRFPNRLRVQPVSDP
jgi:hypothetical protein